MTDTELSADQARRDLYDIMQADDDFETKSRRALELGRGYLGVDNAHLTRIHPEADYWEAVASTDPPDGDFPAGLVLDYNTTYCRTVLDRDDSVALGDAPSQGWADDPAFEEHELHCYHGTPIHVDGEPYGTVCFVSEQPREQPFTDEDTLFAELVARLLEHELERKHHEAQTTRRSNSVTVLSRVLRHNLRNEMCVVRGHVEAVADRLDDDVAISTDLFDSIDDIIALSDKARKLESVVLTDYDRELVALDPVLDRIRTAVGLDYPDATITTDVPAGLSVDLMPSFELAVSELVENAAAHAGPGANVAVEAEETPGGVTVRVRDDGPGLPSQEQEVLAEGVETPLVHGSGLGLWMVYWVVTNHDGTIDATVTDEGTTVTVRIPRVTSEASEATGEVPVLQRGLDRFEAVFEESFDAMVILDDQRRIIDANDHAATLFDLPKSALLGRSIEEFVATSVDIDATWTALQAEGQQEGRLPVVRPDGTELVVEYSATADVLPGQHLLVGRDVTERIERERELEATNRQFEAVLEGVDAAIFIKDAEGRYQLMNRACRELLGVDADSDVEGLTDEDLFPPGVAEQLRTDDRAVLDRGESVEVEERIPTESGTRTFLTRKSPLTDDDGDTVGLCAVSTDITDRIEREQDIEQANQRLRLALEATDTGIWEWDLETDAVTWNESMERLFGLAPGTFEGRFEAVTDRIHPEDLPELEAAIETAIETDDQFEVEARIQRDDGEQIWGYARGELFAGDDGHQRMVGTVTDITERKEREAALRTRTRAIDDAPIGVTITDPSQADNPMVYVNERFCELTGYDEATVRGVNCRVIQGEATDPEAVDRIRTAIEAGEPVSTVLRNYRADGSTFWNEVTIAPVEDDQGKITNWVGFQQDVTERIERERRLELAETVFEKTQDALFLVDVGEDGGFVVERVNEVYEAVTGIPNEAIAGRTPRDVVGEELGAGIEARYRECVDHRDTIQYREEIPVDGEPKTWETKLTPVVEDGTVEKLVGAMREVTGDSPPTAGSE